MRCNCQALATRTLVCLSSTVRRPRSCSRQLTTSPVCDRFNVEHDSPCLLWERGRELDYWGHCRVGVCCGREAASWTTGATVGLVPRSYVILFVHNFCHGFRKYMYSSNQPLSVRHVLFCRLQTGCDNTSVVCGLDRVTYINECHAWANRITADYRGRCRATPTLSPAANQCEAIECSPPGGSAGHHCDAILPAGACCPICGECMARNRVTTRHNQINTISQSAFPAPRNFSRPLYRPGDFCWCRFQSP